MEQESSQDQESPWLRVQNTSGKVIDNRLPGTPCTCKNNCFSKISEYDRADIFNTFNDNGEKEKKDTYLCGLIQGKNIMRLRPRSGVKKSKSVVCKFQLKINYEEYNVCKKAFISVFGITM